MPLRDFVFPSVWDLAILFQRDYIFCAGRPENLKFDWMITDWSKCSQSCGGSGFQVSVCVLYELAYAQLNVMVMFIVLLPGQGCTLYGAPAQHDTKCRQQSVRRCWLANTPYDTEVWHRRLPSLGAQ